MIPTDTSRLDELKDIIKLVIEEIKENIANNEIYDTVNISINLTGNKDIKIHYEKFCDDI